MKKISLLLIVILSSLLFLTGCEQIDGIKAAVFPSSEDTLSESENPEAAPTETSAPTDEPTAVITETPIPAEAAEPTAEPTPEIHTLTLWVPPQFDPAQDSESGTALMEFINQFTAENENLNVVVRVKALTGESSILNTLSAAKNAAPNVIPSLILMSRGDMETAVQRGLIQPIESEILSDPSNWYNYAHQAAFIDNSLYGIPIAGDALVLVYRISKIGAEIQDWEDLISRGMPISFAPSSGSSTFATFLYLIMGGKLSNDQGQPYIDQEKLTATLYLFLNGGQSGVFPPSIAQIQDQAQSWQRFNEGTMNLIVSQYSSFRHYNAKGINAIRIPAFPDHTEYPLATTWNLVMTESKPEIQRLAIKFAEQLSESVKNDDWTHQAGYLPVRVSEHTAWTDDEQFSAMLSINENATIVPSNQTLSKIMPLINNAVIQVIKNNVSPETAAQEAIDALN